MSQFQAGQSGNPGGRPKAAARLRDLARAHDEAAVRTLVEIMGDGDASKAARVAAASQILDRAYGKATQPLDGDGEGGAILQRIERVIVRPATPDR